MMPRDIKKNNMEYSLFCIARSEKVNGLTFKQILELKPFNEANDIWRSAEIMNDEAVRLLQVKGKKSWKVHAPHLTKEQWQSLSGKVSYYKSNVIKYGSEREYLKVLIDRNNKRIKNNGLSLFYMPYEEYLKTDHWLTLRENAKRKDKYRCVLCNYTERLEVHHRSYEFKGNPVEELYDITTLCHECHSRYHNKDSK